MTSSRRPGATEGKRPMTGKLGANGWPEYKRLFVRSLECQDRLEKRVTKLEIEQAVLKSKVITVVAVAILVMELVVQGAMAPILEALFK